MAKAPENARSLVTQLIRSIGKIGKQWRKSWRDHVIASAIGAFLALAGAFGTESVTLERRLVFWILMMVAGSLCVSFISVITSQRPRIGQHKYVWWVLITVLTAAPMSLLAWLLSGALFGAGAPSTLGMYLWVSTIISGATTALMMLINTPGLATAGRPDNDIKAEVRFVARLPSKLDGAVIYSVKAEDHYLSVHTSKGSALILSRLSDAISELDGIEGAQVHRSWWVARHAVTDVRRARNAVSLELKGGVVVPVSRSNVKALRASGWI